QTRERRGGSTVLQSVSRGGPDNELLGADRTGWGIVMEQPSPQQKDLSPRFRCWPWALVIAFGLLFGYYISSTYFTPRHRQYQLDFGKAFWIEPTEAFAPIAYFRKEVYLSALPEQAWLQVAASDNFGLIVNGHTVATLASVKTYETGIYDIKR